MCIKPPTARSVASFDLIKRVLASHSNRVVEGNTLSGALVGLSKV